MRLVSIKFEQSLHVSPKCLPFRSFYINGVYEVNASPSTTHFKLLPFALNEHEAKPNVLKAGSATCVYHSEINAYLMYDPVHPAKGTCINTCVYMYVCECVYVCKNTIYMYIYTHNITVFVIDLG